MLDNKNIKVVSLIFFAVIFSLYILLVINTQGGFRFSLVVFFVSLIIYLLFFNRVFYFLAGKNNDGRIAREATQAEKNSIGFFVLISVFLLSLFCLFLTFSNNTAEAKIESKGLKFGRFHQERKWEIHLNNNYFFDTDYQRGLSLLKGDKVVIEYSSSWLGVIHFKNEYFVIREGTHVKYKRWDAEWAFVK